MLNLGTERYPISIIPSLKSFLRLSYWSLKCQHLDYSFYCVNIKIKLISKWLKVPRIFLQKWRVWTLSLNRMKAYVSRIVADQSQWSVKMLQNENFQFSKCRLQELQQGRNKFFTWFESQHEILCSDTICFWIGYSSFEWLHLNCETNSAIFAWWGTFRASCSH